MSNSIDTIERIKIKNLQLIEMINKTRVDTTYSYCIEKLLDEKINYLVENCKGVLDFGKSSRERFQLFAPSQIQTADINEYEGYPDIICDICDDSTLPKLQYDGIICNAVIEHVYDPFSAVNNMYMLLKDGGACMCYAPFVFRYHAPDDLSFQDYFRFTRDGLALLFKDFSQVTLYSVRGGSSSAFNYSVSGWKRLEKKWPFINSMIDKIMGGWKSQVQVTGYMVWAIK